MIKIVYVPEALVTTFGPMSDPPYVKEMTMTLVDGVTWHEATTEFRNFLRGAGYVIPYEHEEDEDDWRCWTPMTFEEIQDLERKHQKRYDGVSEPHFDRIGFANAIEKRLKELNT